MTTVEAVDQGNDSGSSDSARSGDEEDSDDEDIDPRVQEELENLNQAASEINKLELELEKARTHFQKKLAESTKKLSLIYKRRGTSVARARPYYELLKQSRLAQAEAERAVLDFQKTTSAYHSARHKVTLAEESITAKQGATNHQLQSAWQELLNHATIQFMKAEQDKELSEIQHQEKAKKYAEIKKKLYRLERDISNSISKAREYFDVKEKLEYQLQQERQNMEDLQLALGISKDRYRCSLGQLEAISDQVHLRRHSRTYLPPRTPGVGAESISETELPSCSLDTHDTASLTSQDDNHSLSCIEIYESGSCVDDPTSQGEHREQGTADVGEVGTSRYSGSGYSTDHRLSPSLPADHHVCQTQNKPNELHPACDTRSGLVSRNQIQQVTSQAAVLCHEIELGHGIQKMELVDGVPLSGKREEAEGQPDVSSADEPGTSGQPSQTVRRKNNEQSSISNQTSHIVRPDTKTRQDRSRPLGRSQTKTRSRTPIRAFPILVGLSECNKELTRQSHDTKHSKHSS